jgi:hypothetical protein
MCVFAGTVLAYNALKYSKLIYDGNLQSPLFEVVVVSAVFALLLFGGCFYLLSFRLQLLIVIAGFFVFMYPLLRKFGSIKIFWVSFVIAFTTSFVIIQSVLNFNGNVMLLLLERFLFLCALMVPFEIRDSQYDDVSLKTLPQRLGIQKMKYLGFSFCLLFLIVGVYNGRAMRISDGVVVLFLMWSIYRIQPNSSKYSTLFWVEAIPIAGFLVDIVIAKN